MNEAFGYLYIVSCAFWWGMLTYYNFVADANEDDEIMIPLWQVILGGAIWPITLIVVLWQLNKKDDST